MRGRNGTVRDFKDSPSQVLSKNIKIELYPAPYPQSDCAEAYAYGWTVEKT